MSSIVYFIQQGHGNYFKIGRTDGSAETRLKDLQTGNPKRLRVFGVIECNGKTQISESRLHQEFDPYRVGGEWFCVNPTRIVEVLNENDGKIFVEDPLSVEFVKGKDRMMVIEKHTGIDQLEMKLAKARAIKRRKRLAIMVTILISIPIAFAISALVSGFIFMIHSTSNDAKDFENSYVFFNCMKIFVPLIYVTSFCLRIGDNSNISEAPDDEIILEFAKGKTKE